MKRNSLVPIQPIGGRGHRKTGVWEWDFQIEGYVANSARDFECDCGSPIPTPSHTKCACGKIWNSYVIGTAGNGKEASVEKYVCREIPVRENVIVSNRRTGSRTASTLDRLFKEAQENLRRHEALYYNKTMEKESQFDRLFKEALQNRSQE